MAEKIQPDFEYRELTDKEQRQLSNLFGGPDANCIRVGPKGYCVPKAFSKCASDIINMEFKPGDVFVDSVQRSGTTWTQELVWLVANDLDFKTAAEVPLTQRYAFLEQPMLFNGVADVGKLSTSTDEQTLKAVQKFMSTPAKKLLRDMKPPRFIKSHLPISLLSPKILDSSKVVYVARDPRDVIVSCFYHYQFVKVMQFKGSLKQLWEAFKDDLVKFTPFFEHVKEAWNLRHHPNMLFLFYEDLSRDMPGAIKQVADFFGKQLSPAETESLCEHLKFDNFKNNKSVNLDNLRKMGLGNPDISFIRKGKSGGWRENFDEEMTQEARLWIEHNLRDTDLRFPST